MREALARGRLPLLNPPPERRPRRIADGLSRQPEVTEGSLLPMSARIAPEIPAVVFDFNSPGGEVSNIRELMDTFDARILESLYNPYLEESYRRRLMEGQWDADEPRDVESICRIRNGQGDTLTSSVRVGDQTLVRSTRGDETRVRISGAVRFRMPGMAMQAMYDFFRSGEVEVLGSAGPDEEVTLAVRLRGEPRLREADDGDYLIEWEGWARVPQPRVYTHHFTGHDVEGFYYARMLNTDARIYLNEPAFPPKAAERARALLFSHLTPALREQYSKGYIEVRGQLTPLTYRVNTSGLTYNIVAADSDAFVNLCAAPSGRMPREDKLLGQVMGLRCDERRFIRAANIRPSGSEASARLLRALQRFADGGEFRVEDPPLGEIPVVLGRSPVASRLRPFVFRDEVM